jgi:hypothetical protein
VIEAAHNLNAASRAVDRHVTGRTPGTLTDGRERNRTAFRAINAFPKAARGDVGVSGEAHPERDLLLPETRREGEWTVPTISGDGGGPALAERGRRIGMIPALSRLCAAMPDSLKVSKIPGLPG